MPATYRLVMMLTGAGLTKPEVAWVLKLRLPVVASRLRQGRAFLVEALRLKEGGR